MTFYFLLVTYFPIYISYVTNATNSIKRTYKITIVIFELFFNILTIFYNIIFKSSNSELPLSSSVTAIAKYSDFEICL